MDTLILVDPRGVEWVVEVPSRARDRLRGLLGRRGLPACTGMLFLNCHSIHTVGMRFGLDVVFLDGSFRAVEVRLVPPGRWWVRRARATHILEAPAGSGLRTGDQLQRR
ncbi:MAG: uncharacterized protein QOI60_489 [Actinomycetota bacterium]|nr:uncharacterized protein [Actinomycetota bacterium]MEA2579150.1 uncharacterized protein [Actinomycetota bacterium]